MSFQAETNDGEIMEFTDKDIDSCLDNLPQFREVRCCCNPENLLGYLPADVTDYEVLELEQGGSAFNANDEEDLIRARPDFLEKVMTGVTLDVPEETSAKTWKKTWRK